MNTVKYCFKNYIKLHEFVLINLQLPVVILKKSSISDMHHRTTYMYINFQQNQVSRSVKYVDTNLFAQKLQVA